MATATADAASDLDPTERAAWRTIVWRALRRFDSDQMTHHAAALTYYAMLSLFPSLIVAVAMLGVFGGEETVIDVTDYLRRNGAPDSVVAPADAILSNAVRSGGGAVSVALVLGLVVGLIGASGAFAAARRALNVAYGVSEDRGFVHRKLGDIGSTLVLIAFAVLALVAVFLGGGVADDLFSTLGFGETAASVWQVVRWPAAFAVMLGAFSYVYAVAPDLESRHVRIFTPGGVVAVALWVGVTYLFFAYLGRIGDLKAYGTFASAVVVLLWLWLTNAALLLGAELNAAATNGGRPERHEPLPLTPPPAVPAA